VGGYRANVFLEDVLSADAQLRGDLQDLRSPNRLWVVPIRFDLIKRAPNSLHTHNSRITVLLRLHFSPRMAASCRFAAQWKDRRHNMLGHAPNFDIFRGPIDNPTWVENVVGLVKAIEHMERHAAEKPDAYFIFDRKTETVVARVNGKYSG